MRSIIKLDLILVLLLFVSTILKGSSSEDSFDRCEHIVKKWASSSLDREVKEDKHVLKDLLFFLHIPRTGGRTYFHCFLTKLYSKALECPRSYDRLRFNPRKSNCKLLSTHDDYSMMSKLQEDKTSVVTILRNPIDRVFSTYEFSIEVAARFLVHPNLTSATRMTGRIRSKAKGPSTLDIWPWKYLVPWMREDLFARREARMLKGQVHLGTNDSYNMEDIVMPLHHYINDPIAQEIIHNGATFQIAGLTNNSYIPESHEVRQCVLRYQTLGEYVLEVAKKRLDDMLYVGLTENHKESATMFANVVGAQVISQISASSSSEDVAVRNSSELSSSSQDSEPDSDYQGSNSTYQKPRKSSSPENLTTRKLIEAYETCISNLRTAQAERRINSLKRISPANFTKEARSKVPESLLREITSLNSLDMELYKYAQSIFSKQRVSMMSTIAVVDKPDSELKSPYEATSWRGVLLVVSVFFLLIFLLLVVNARRRTSKLKL